MNISPTVAALPQQNVSTEPKFALPDSREFASGLTIGQIIKGRVLLQYEDSRYLVAFDGRERVVDSSVPLETGEILRGRVIATGDRLELQRLPDDRDGDLSSLPVKAKGVAEGRAPAAFPTELDAFFARYRAELPADGRDVLVRMLRASPDRNLVMLAALTIAKLGLPQNQALLQAVTATLKKIPVADSAPPADGAVTLPAGVELTAQLRELVRQALSAPSGLNESARFAESQMAGTLQGSTQRDDTNKAMGKPATSQLASLVLNAQSGGSVAHRVGTLPLIVNDRLVEVDIAVFDHNRDGSARSDTRHRALVFVLNLKHLGLVEVAATVVDDRLRIRIGAGSSESASRLSVHSAALRDTLAEAGWAVDDVVYETLAPRTSNSAVRSVIEHVISQDSVNRLV